ncbi:MAG TPA: PilZ domain-containing protein [Candidatus Aquilonibacter sp.]|nr:PilZ domain-containing protein [Candidatus Aquilonibacter sp.]
MTLDGRMEARVPIVIPIYLQDAKRATRLPELALTENVSATGARLVTKWRRQPGRQQRLTLLSGDTMLSAEIVYCHPIPEGGYRIGLKLLERSAGWWNEQAVPPRASPTMRWAQMWRQTFVSPWAKSRG